MKLLLPILLIASITLSTAQADVVDTVRETVGTAFDATASVAHNVVAGTTTGVVDTVVGVVPLLSPDAKGKVTAKILNNSINVLPHDPNSAAFIAGAAIGATTPTAVGGAAVFGLTKQLKQMNDKLNKLALATQINRWEAKVDSKVAYWVDPADKLKGIRSYPTK